MCAADPSGQALGELLNQHQVLHGLLVPSTTALHSDSSSSCCSAAFPSWSRSLLFGDLFSLVSALGSSWDRLGSPSVSHQCAALQTRLSVGSAVQGGPRFHFLQTSRACLGWLGRGKLAVCEGAEEEQTLQQEGEQPQAELLSLLKGL